MAQVNDRAYDALALLAHELLGAQTDAEKAETMRAIAATVAHFEIAAE